MKQGGGGSACLASSVYMSRWIEDWVIGHCIFLIWEAVFSENPGFLTFVPLVLLLSSFPSNRGSTEVIQRCAPVYWASRPLMKILISFCLWFCSLDYLWLGLILDLRALTLFLAKFIRLESFSCLLLLEILLLWPHGWLHCVTIKMRFNLLLMPSFLLQYAT